MRTTALLSEIITEWITSLDVMPATRDDYQRKVKLWFRWLASIKVDPREPQRLHVLDYKRHLIQEGHSAVGVGSYITVVRIFYKYCSARGIYDNIGSDIKSSFKKRNFTKHPLSKEQAQLLIASIQTETIIGKRDKLIIALMLINGLRTCEMERIDICDFDKFRGQTVLRIKRKGKSEKSDTVAVPPLIDSLFEEYTSCRDFKLSDPLFLNHSVSGKGERLGRISISLMVKRRLKSIGIDDPRITAHSLRHTCGSLLLESGVDVETIKNILGHSSTATTRIYIEMAQQQRLLTDSPTKIIADMLQKPPQRGKK